jgi:hypothetical protein
LVLRLVWVLPFWFAPYLLKRLRNPEILVAVLL